MRDPLLCSTERSSSFSSDRPSKHRLRCSTPLFFRVRACLYRVRILRAYASLITRYSPCLPPFPWPRRFSPSHSNLLSTVIPLLVRSHHHLDLPREDRGEGWLSHQRQGSCQCPPRRAISKVQTDPHCARSKLFPATFPDSRSSTNVCRPEGKNGQNGRSVWEGTREKESTRLPSKINERA